MKVISGRKKRYYKLDDVGFVGSQVARSTKKVTLDGVKTARAIRTLKNKVKVKN